MKLAVFLEGTILFVMVVVVAIECGWKRRQRGRGQGTAAAEGGGLLDGINASICSDEKQQHQYPPITA